MSAEVETNALIGALLYLVHPELFHQQMGVLEELYGGSLKVGKRALMEEAFEGWSSPFTGFALIANRESALHRDKNGGKLLLDLLAAFGRYTGGRLDVPLLGRFAYNPGTGFVLPGHLFQHGASKTEGERICMANFIRPNIGYGVFGDRYTEISPPKVDKLTQHHELPRPHRRSCKNIWPTPKRPSTSS